MLDQDQKKTKVNDNFTPPTGLKNPHVQTIFSSFGPRRFKIRKTLAVIESKQQPFVLDCGDGVRLTGALNLANANEKPSNKLAILIHGWEGCLTSGYIVSMTGHLLNNGIDVFRLNLRDHGGSQHLNKKIFNATMINEVIGAIEELQAQHNYQEHHLIGFSLGGNFSLRVAVLAKDRAIALDNVIAFCPAVHAKASNDALNEPKNWFYGKYFIRRWKRSLLKKLEHYPEYEYGPRLSEMKTLNQMNEELIPVYTEFSNVDDYYNAYAIGGDYLSETICPCYLHFSIDDMVIPIDDVLGINQSDNLHITVTEYGGHCGFLSNWKLDSWQDERALEIILN